MTATEVLSRQEQRLRLLGPVMGRLQEELLKPLIDRCFGLCSGKVRLWHRQKSCRAWEIDIEMISPLAKAQKQSELQNTMRGIEVLSQMSQIAPVLDYIDGDRLVSTWSM